MTYLIVEDGVIKNTIVAEKDFAEKIGAKEYYDGANIGDVYNPPVDMSKEREKLYNTLKAIEFCGELLTITEANEKYLYYLAEGNSEKTAELQNKIKEEKDKIREEYPDQDDNSIV